MINTIHKFQHLDQDHQNIITNQNIQLIVILAKRDSLEILEKVTIMQSKIIIQKLMQLIEKEKLQTNNLA